MMRMRRFQLRGTSFLLSRLSRSPPSANSVIMYTEKVLVRRDVSSILHAL
jgi:hypothetical protein